MCDAAAAHAANGSDVSIHDARFIVLNIFREENAEWPSPDDLEVLASVQVRLTSHAQGVYSARLCAKEVLVDTMVLL